MCDETLTSASSGNKTLLSSSTSSPYDDKTLPTLSSSSSADDKTPSTLSNPTLVAYKSLASSTLPDPTSIGDKQSASTASTLSIPSALSTPQTSTSILSYKSWSVIERLYWIYIDHLLHSNNVKLIDFASEWLKTFKPNDKQELFTSLKGYYAYKNSIPTAGGIPLCYCEQNKEWMMLLPQPENKPCWSVVKGKPNQDTETTACTAARELNEEIGYRVSPEFLETCCYSLRIRTCSADGGSSESRIYLIPGVPQDYPFEIQCKGEISSFKWIPVNANSVSSYHLSYLMRLLFPTLLLFTKHLLPETNLITTPNSMCSSFETECFLNAIAK